MFKGTHGTIFVKTLQIQVLTVLNVSLFRMDILQMYSSSYTRYLAAF